MHRSEETNHVTFEELSSIQYAFASAPVVTSILIVFNVCVLALPVVAPL